MWWAVSIGVPKPTERTTVVEEGKRAPDFELASDSGETVKLSDLRGRQVVLYFYPKDDTPGCTTQACGIRDLYEEFQREGAVVLGVGLLRVGPVEVGEDLVVAVENLVAVDEHGDRVVADRAAHPLALLRFSRHLQGQEIQAELGQPLPDPMRVRAPLRLVQLHVPGRTRNRSRESRPD